MILASVPYLPRTNFRSKLNSDSDCLVLFTRGRIPCAGVSGHSQNSNCLEMHASSSAEWRSLMQRSVDAGRTAFLQLATLSTDGRPTVRTVVFRGWESGTALRFVIDLRSSKVRNGHLEWAEACYYSTDTREQFRLTGPLSVLGPDATSSAAATRSSQWAELSDAARAQFCWPAPGESRASDQPFEPDQPSETEAVDNFAVLLLRPTQVDH